MKKVKGLALFLALVMMVTIISIPAVVGAASYEGSLDDDAVAEINELLGGDYAVAAELDFNASFDVSTYNASSNYDVEINGTTELSDADGLVMSKSSEFKWDIVDLVDGSKPIVFRFKQDETGSRTEVIFEVGSKEIYLNKKYNAGLNFQHGDATGQANAAVGAFSTYILVPRADGIDLYQNLEDGSGWTLASTTDAYMSLAGDWKFHMDSLVYDGLNEAKSYVDYVAVLGEPPYVSPYVGSLSEDGLAEINELLSEDYSIAQQLDFNADFDVTAFNAANDYDLASTNITWASATFSDDGFELPAGTDFTWGGATNFAGEGKPIVFRLKKDDTARFEILQGNNVYVDSNKTNGLYLGATGYTVNSASPKSPVHSGAFATYIVMQGAEGVALYQNLEDGNGWTYIGSSTGYKQATGGFQIYGGGSGNSYIDYIAVLGEAVDIPALVNDAIEAEDYETLATLITDTYKVDLGIGDETVTDFAALKDKDAVLTALTGGYAELAEIKADFEALVAAQKEEEAPASYAGSLNDKALAEISELLDGDYSVAQELDFNASFNVDTYNAASDYDVVDAGGTAIDWTTALSDDGLAMSYGTNFKWGGTTNFAGKGKPIVFRLKQDISGTRTSIYQGNKVYLNYASKNGLNVQASGTGAAGSDYAAKTTGAFSTYMAIEGETGVALYQNIEDGNGWTYIGSSTGFYSTAAGGFDVYSSGHDSITTGKSYFDYIAVLEKELSPEERMVAEINAAITGADYASLETLLTVTYKTALGIEAAVADYSALVNKNAALATLAGGYADAAAIKTAFDDAVAARKTVEAGYTYKSESELMAGAEAEKVWTTQADFESVTLNGFAQNNGTTVQGDSLVFPSGVAQGMYGTFTYNTEETPMQIGDIIYGSFSGLTGTRNTTQDDAAPALRINMYTGTISYLVNIYFGDHTGANPNRIFINGEAVVTDEVDFTKPFELIYKRIANPAGESGNFLLELWAKNTDSSKYVLLGTPYAVKNSGHTYGYSQNAFLPVMGRGQGITIYEVGYYTSKPLTIESIDATAGSAIIYSDKAYDNVTVIFAAYDADGALVDMKYNDEVDLTVGSNDVNVGAVKAAVTVKAFIWENLTSLKPLCGQYIK